MVHAGARVPFRHDDVGMVEDEPVGPGRNRRPAARINTSPSVVAMRRAITSTLADAAV